MHQSEVPIRYRCWQILGLALLQELVKGAKTYWARMYHTFRN